MPQHPCRREPRLLVVDDEPANVLLLTRILSRAGYREVIGTRRSSEVMDVFENYEIDIVLLDLHMPPPDGWELLDRFRACLAGKPFLPLIVLTADVTRETRSRALAAGASDFLIKPFDSIEVVLRIRNLIELRFLHLELAWENKLLDERVRLRTAELEETQCEMLERLAQASEFHDDETGSHTRRVGESAAALGAAMGLPPSSVALLRRTAPLHDVGKIGIPETILRKPGSLSPEERGIMESHSEIGGRILAGGRSANVQMAEEIARSHHERWDGSGYPKGLAGEAIPLSARIVAVADVYDALAHDRPYRKALPREQVVEEIRAGSGSHFDPRVVTAFLRLPPPGSTSARGVPTADVP
ncbi:MAG: response regulator [Gemmatimonadetes bacterium]|nr:response regulator [Gemmatimonadota bacterium]